MVTSNIYATAADIYLVIDRNTPNCNVNNYCLLVEAALIREFPGLSVIVVPGDVNEDGTTGAGCWVSGQWFGDSLDEDGFLPDVFKHRTDTFITQVAETVLIIRDVLYTEYYA